jgi:hypothetical protein
VRNRETTDSPANIADAGLLQHRDYIRSSLHSIHPGLLRQVLQAMDERRNARRAVPAKLMPSADMGAAEMQREIIWRLDTLPLGDAEAIAALVRQLLESAQ